MFERLSSEPIYNTRAVVQRTAVPADTFRAWERRYGIPSPSRTPGRQRLYSERDIATIGWLRDQTSSGMMISQAIALLQSKTARSTSLSSDPTASVVDVSNQVRGDEAAAFRPLRDQLVEALTRLDGNAADQIVEEALALTNLEGVCLHVLQGALIEIGNQWEHGTATVAVEHFASCYVHRKFGSLFNQSSPNEGRGPIVAACPEGELHEIGLLLTSLFLSRRGYRIIYLGANLPVEDLVDIVEHVQPPLVMFSAARVETASEIAKTIPWLKRAVRNAAGRDWPLIGFGGRVFVDHPALCESIDGIYLGDDARAAAINADRLFARLHV